MRIPPNLNPRPFAPTPLNPSTLKPAFIRPDAEPHTQEVLTSCSPRPKRCETPPDSLKPKRFRDWVWGIFGFGSVAAEAYSFERA